MNDYDVIVIGAGPAGCASALFLHEQGLRVVVLDRAAFPRDKVCGEFISPAADDILQDLGVLDAIQQTHPVRLKGVSISSYGKPELRIDYPPCPGQGKTMTSLSLSRFQLDHLLVRQLGAQGLVVREKHAVDDFLIEEDRVVGVRGRDEAVAGRRAVPEITRCQCRAGDQQFARITVFHFGPVLPDDPDPRIVDRATYGDRFV